MALFYADSSALVKLVRDEPESAALRTYLAGADLVSCELVLTEVPRAVRRAASDDRRLPLDPFDAFVTYDERQAAAARLAGLRTTAPGS
jgi:predicted nucleic acid-binding protein